MRVLIDECVPRALKPFLSKEDHECRTVQEAGWAGKKNGDLLSLAEDAFDVLITLDTNLSYQQNLAGRKIAIVVIRSSSNRRATPTALRGRLRALPWVNAERRGALEERCLRHPGLCGSNLPTRSERNERISEEEFLLDLRLALQLEEPVLKNLRVARAQFIKGHGHSHIGLRIDDVASGLECFLVIDDLNPYNASDGQRVHHVKVAAVTAQFARAACQAHSRPLLDNVGRSKKGVTG